MGLILSAIDQSFPPRSHFSVDDIPDLKGRIMLVTGGNSGIGKETVKALLSHGAKVYMASRSEDKVRRAIRDIESDPAVVRTTAGGQVVFLEIDLGDLGSVKRAAETFLSQEAELHVLFNNAGIGGLPCYGLTKDGYDAAMGTNVLAHFYLTKLLMPALLAGSKSSQGGKARVVNVSSITHYLVRSLDFNTFQDGPARRKDWHQLYSQSKFGVVVFSNELAKRYGEQGIVSIALNPGNLKTNIMSHSPVWEQFITRPFVYDVSTYGALTQLWAGTSHETEGFNGKYLIPWAREGTARAETADKEMGKELWEWMGEQVQGIE